MELNFTEKGEGSINKYHKRIIIYIFLLVWLSLIKYYPGPGTEDLGIKLVRLDPPMPYFGPSPIFGGRLYLIIKI